MKIERLHLERYGAFTGRVLEFQADASLHVVLGANEAGKTSTLQAIGDLLFGFDQRTSYSVGLESGQSPRIAPHFLHERKMLRVGAQLRLANGRVFSIRRRKGDKNTLLDDADKPLADDPLAPLLGSLTRESFFAEFGLTSSALRAGGLDLLKAGGRLAETLAASSAQLSALMRLRGQLDQESDSLFGPRRSAGKAFYAALDRHEQAEKRLRDAIVTADSYAAAERAVAEAEIKRETLERQHHDQSRDLKRRERARRVWKKLDQLRRLREELSQLGDLPPVSREAVKEWRDALQLQATIDDELARQQIEAMDAAEEIAALKIDAPLIDFAAEVDALRERLGEIRKAESDLPRRREASRAAREQLDELARRLGLVDADALIVRQPSDATISGVEAAMEARSDAEKRLFAEQEKAVDAERRLQELEQSQTPGEALVDPASFRQRLATFADLPSEADRARHDLVAFDHSERELLKDAQRLGPSPGTPDTLASLPLPDSAQIEEFRRRFETLKEAEQREAQELDRLAISLAEIDEELTVLSQAGEMSTRDQLSAARRERDAAMTRSEPTARPCFCSARGFRQARCGQPQGRCDHQRLA